MKSLYREEVEPISNLLNEGIEERLQINNGEEDETIELLKFIIKKINSYKGDYIRIPPIPKHFLASIDVKFIRELLSPRNKNNNYYFGVYMGLDITIDDLQDEEYINDIG